MNRREVFKAALAALGAAAAWPFVKPETWPARIARVRRRYAMSSLRVDPMPYEGTWVRWDDALRAWNADRSNPAAGA